MSMSTSAFGRRASKNPYGVRSGFRLLLHFVAVLSALLLMPSCTLYSMTISPRRDATPQTVQLSQQVRLSATGAINMYVVGVVDHQDFVPASFKIETPHKRIYVDPVVVEPDQADYIFITHDHDDHLSLPDIDKLTGPQTLIICPAAVASMLGARQHRVVAPGDSFDLDGVQVQAIAAYNLRGGMLGLKAHPENAHHVGYVLEVEGIRILHVGDSDKLLDHLQLKDIAVALLPIAGGDLTMSTVDSARIVNALKPRLAIPMHYPVDSDEAERFRALIDPSIEVLVLQQTR